MLIVQLCKLLKDNGLAQCSHEITLCNNMSYLKGHVPKDNIVNISRVE